MVIDGVAASEAIDSSGEILDVKGCDISDLEEGRGVLNFEHKGEHDAGSSFNDIIGRIIFAKKIYTETDCANEREKFYWNQVKLPFIYIQCELFDQDGHKGAESAAGMIRHYHKRQLPILVRYSIEGVTLQKENNRLLRCIAKRIAATIKPCNKSCHSGVLEDPHDGFEAKLDETPDPIEQLVDQADAKKFEHPEYTKLGGSHEIELETPELNKTLTAGNYNVAPGSLEGGAALQVSELTQRHNFLKAQALAAYRDWDKQTDFRKFIKMRLLDVDPGFIDHFVNLVEDYHKIKLKKSDNPADEHFTAPPASVRPEYPDKTPQLDPPKARKPELKPVRKDGLKFHPNGTLATQKHNLQVHVPEIASSNSPYFQILYPTKATGLSDEKRAEYLEKIHKPWLRAMGNWMILNDAMKEGKLPESVVYHAGMFSAMSPNTSVPVQELYYGHIMDLIHKYGFDPRDPVHSEHLSYLKDMISGGRLPEWQRQMYEEKGHKEGDGKKSTSTGDAPQILGFENYHAIHPYLMDLIHHHRDDGQQIVASLMHMKNVAQLAAKKRKSVSHAPVTGFGIKLARYMMLMSGAGNLLVPDRHMMRSLFNINPRTGGEKLSHLTNVFEESTAEKAMRALDQFFFEHHPAAQYVLSKFPEHFKGREQQAIGPAFWLHWLATPHYEAAQGMENPNTQVSGTDHMPYWHSIRPQIEQILRKYHVDFNENADFNFGHNVAKTEARTAPVACRTAHAMKEIEDKFGESAAHFAFHSYMVPVLMDANRNLKKPILDHLIMKAQSLTIDLSKALADFKETTPRGIYKLYDQSEGTPRLIARFAIHDDQVQILEDTGVLKPYFSDGIVTQKVHDGIQQLRNTPNLKLTTVADENGEKYDALKDEPIAELPKRAKAYYEFRMRGLASKHVLEVNGNRVKYDARSLTEEEVHALMDEVRSGIATLRLLPSPNMVEQRIAKAEQAFIALEKKEPIDTNSDGLGNLYAWAMFKEDAPEGVYLEMDANDFTFINTTHGYSVGDKALSALGKAVLETAREVGKKAKVFRGSGDTFHAWFAEKEEAELFCRKLRTNLEQIPSIGGTHNLTVSIGIGATPEDAQKAQTKAKRAKYATNGYKAGQAEQHVYSLLPGSEGAVPFEQLPPLKHQPPK